MNRTKIATVRGGLCPGPSTALVSAAACLASVLVPAASAAPAPRADLTVASVRVTPSAKPGESIAIAVTVKNAGRVPTAPTKTTFALSKDTALGGDLKLSERATTRAVRPGKKRVTKLTVVLPDGTPDGSYYVLACADASRKVRESKEKNNCRASAAAVEVISVFEGTLSGTLTFSDVGESATGMWDSWNRSATATINMSVSGPHMGEVFASTGSSYTLSGTRDDVNQGPSCTYERHRTERGSGTLLYTGSAVNDDLYGKFTKTDLSGLSLGVAMPYGAELQENLCGESKTTSARSRDASDIKLAEVSRTATTITYRPVEWFGLLSGTSEWDSVTGDVVLTRTN
ncbi:CARDB domain-containing protein [Nocardioides sp. Soil805]|uniref:CARDB domain-containing protein n=1 Tax=Nocardioides sp. Soil805 TaxID=1736416 RepID=UPI0009E894FC|nr:CARDB domain-containing protein [Nocardioides sp. Soil805]